MDEQVSMKMHNYVGKVVGKGKKNKYWFRPLQVLEA